VTGLAYKARVHLGVYYALMLEYRSEIFLWALAGIMPFIMLGAWTKAASHGGIGMTAAAVGRYFIAVFIVRQFSIVWFIYDFEFQVVEGRLSGLLLKPMHPMWGFVAAHLGEQLARLPFIAGIVALAFVLYPTAFWVPSPISIGLGIITIYAAFTLRFVLQYCFAMMCFWFERASALEYLNFLPYLYLSGFIAPLELYPPAARQWIEWTPFPYMVYFPAQILTGEALKQGPAYLLQHFAVMGAWMLLLWLIGNAMWKRGVRHYSGMGA
jgi:ABC-2 type transport system permease protein